MVPEVPVKNLPALAILATAVGCAPALSPPSESKAPATGTTDTAPDIVEDSAEPEDTAPVEDDTDDVEVLPPGQADAVVTPPPQLFTRSLDLTLTSSGEVGEVYACVGVPDRVCTLEPATTLTLDRSGVVYARVVIDEVEGPISAWPYVAVDTEVAAFTSNLPVFVAWTNEARDDLWVNTPMALLGFDHPTERTALDEPATFAARSRLRIRGSSSSGLTKKNYDLELWAPDSEDDAPAELLGMPADADWVLHAPSYYDDALIRNALGYSLSRDIGRYAPHTELSELFLLVGNSTLTTASYSGVYVLTEEIERGEDRVDVARLDEYDTAWPEVSGGYVFKRDREGESGEGFYAGDGGGRFSFSVPIVPVDPEHDELVDEQTDYLAGELDSFGYALAAASGIDPTSGRPWRDIVDEDSFIDHHILAVLVKNPDAFRLSGYFHKDREQPIHAGPIWDLDRTAGSIDSRARDPHHWDASNETSDTTPVFTYGWYGAMFDDPAFRLRYWARWQTLLAGPLSPAAVDARIDELAAQLEEAGPRNNTRWGAAPWTTELENLRAWYAARLGWIDTCIERFDDPRDCAGADPTP